jgi:hypothetical protein
LVSGYVLERAASLVPDGWMPIPEPIGVEADQNVVTVEASAETGFFRLRKP